MPDSSPSWAVLWIFLSGSSAQRTPRRDCGVSRKGNSFFMSGECRLFSDLINRKGRSPLPGSEIPDEGKKMGEANSLLPSFFLVQIREPAVPEDYLISSTSASSRGFIRKGLPVPS